MENIHLTNNNDNYIEVKLNVNYSTKLTLKEDAQLSDLKKAINKKFNLNEGQYDLYIKDFQLTKSNINMKVSNLMQIYKTNEIVVKSYKSISNLTYVDAFELKQELIEYNKYLDISVSQQEKEMKEFMQLYEELRDTFS